MLVSRWINEMVANSSSCDSIGKVVSSHGSLITILGLDEVQRLFLIIVGGLALLLGVLACQLYSDMGRLWY